MKHESAPRTVQEQDLEIESMADNILESYQSDNLEDMADNILAKYDTPEPAAEDPEASAAREAEKQQSVDDAREDVQEALDDAAQPDSSNAPDNEPSKPEPTLESAHQKLDVSKIVWNDGNYFGRPAPLFESRPAEPEQRPAESQPAEERPAQHAQTEQEQPQSRTQPEQEQPKRRTQPEREPRPEQRGARQPEHTQTSRPEVPEEYRDGLTDEQIIGDSFGKQRAVANYTKDRLVSAKAAKLEIQEAVATRGGLAPRWHRRRLIKLGDKADELEAKQGASLFSFVNKGRARKLERVRKKAAHHESKLQGFDSMRQSNTNELHGYEEELESRLAEQRSTLVNRKLQAEYRKMKRSGELGLDVLKQTGERDPRRRNHIINSVRPADRRRIARQAIAARLAAERRGRGVQ